MANRTVEAALKELWYWQHGTNPTNFTSRLYELFQQADMENQHRLAAAFPMEWNAFTLWYTAPDPKAFFEELKQAMTERELTEEHHG